MLWLLDVNATAEVWVHHSNAVDIILMLAELILQYTQKHLTPLEDSGILYSFQKSPSLSQETEGDNLKLNEQLMAASSGLCLESGRPLKQQRHSLKEEEEE